MTPLLTAIISKWQEATAITASGPWVDVAADTATYPFGIITILGTGGHEPFYGGEYDEIVNVRFTIYHVDNGTTGIAPLLTAQTALHTRFDKTKLTLSSGRNYHSLRTGQMTRFAGVDKDGNKIHQAISDYQFKVRKSY